ncbi:MAG: hypothetical protein Unbinned4388contig1000_55 [Prokaryotic dsDNA virus sp.]|nr:MAG: hypothetical protein Unbinned4388contig1000_55 [Prokaryotic dsDNA virus sp.]|tara:strand:- start:64857 stop:65675 length:819 start_codon:yes stop_codon:yes gene_type:complete
MEHIDLKLPNGKDYLSYSSGKHMATHPVSYLAYMKDKFEPSEAMIFGTFYEALLCEPHTIDDKYTIFSESNLVEQAEKDYGKPTKNIRATKVYKDLKEAALKDLNPEYVISEEEYEKALKMALIMTESGVFDEHLNGDYQMVNTGIVSSENYVAKALCKSDVVIGGGERVIDLKTTSSVLDGFLSQGKKLGYDLQAFLSMEIWGVEEFTFVVQRTQGLLDVGVFKIHEGSWFYESGKSKWEKALVNYKSFFSEDAIALQINPSNYVLYQEIF